MTPRRVVFVSRLIRSAEEGPSLLSPRAAVTRPSPRHVRATPARPPDGDEIAAFYKNAAERRAPRLVPRTRRANPR